jgi:hypothetical protein
MSTPSSGRAPAGKTRIWILFFVMLVILGATVNLVLLWYNRSLQLREEDVAAAHDLWLNRGPADYDLEYMAKIDDDEPVEYRVAVRSRRVLWVASRNDVIMSAELHDALGPAVGCPVQCCYKTLATSDELTKLHSIDAFFTLIESKMRDDAAAGARNYATAIFDLKDGHPLRYVHRVQSSHQRIELHVRLLPPGESTEAR